MFSWFGKVSFVPYSKVQDFAVHLKDGRLMGSLCKDCGFQTFPPRADCPHCLSDRFDFKQYSGKGTLFTFTRIDAAPTGFDNEVPYTIAVVELAEGGRALGWFGDTIPGEEIRIGMEVQVVPRICEDTENIRVYYTVEKPGTTWKEAPPPHLG
jgi:uncharacterized OB-fold protein